MTGNTKARIIAGLVGWGLFLAMVSTDELGYGFGALVVFSFDMLVLSPKFRIFK